MLNDLSNAARKYRGAGPRSHAATTSSPQQISRPPRGHAASSHTHPAPFVGSYDGPAQCYTCHRNDLAPQMGLTAANNPNTDSAGNQHATPSASVHSVCSQCHYGTLDYSYERASSITYQPSDFPHSGKPTDIKLLGSYTTTFIDNNGNWSATYQAATITEGNLDAVCLRCHPGVGVHQ